MKTLRSVLFFILFISTVSAYGFFEKLPSPEDTEFSLLTVGVGSGLESRFGHTILRVRDKSTGEDHLLNWGTYDWEAPNFVLNFLKGFLRYWVAESTFASTLRYYRDYEKRSIVEDRINLTPEQKSQLLKILVAKLQPEGKYFWYDFFYNNCSTIPRDVLNAVLHNRVAEAGHKLAATMNLRAYVRRDLSEWSVVAFFLDIMLNREVDKTIDAWVEMFVPLMLRNYLSHLPQFDDQGQPISGTHLLSDQRELVAGGVYPSSSINFFLCCLIASLLVLGSVLWLRLRNSRWADVLLAFSCIVWGLFAGFLGILLLLGWTYSNHILLNHNANMWVFWPIDGILVAFGIAVLCRKNPSAKLWQFFFGAHLLALAVFIVGYCGAFFIQDVSNIARYLVPIAVLLYGMLLRRKISHTL